MPTLFDLTGRVALITGGNRGIGKGIARGLGEAGASLAIAGRDPESLVGAREELRQVAPRVETFPTDVAHVDQIRRMAESTLEAFGRIDILVNVAGMNRRGPSIEVTEDDWDTIQAVNLKSVFFACQAVAPAMIRQGGGKIISIASLTSVIGIRGTAVYGASKGGVAQLTKSLAVEWAEHNIQVNAIGPGFIETDLTAPLFADPQRSAWIHSRIPAGRRGYPVDLAGAALYLASPASDYLTGQVLYVDGGFLAG
jgi:NAD(P)-dependent dehydrogenase (short-subunit alcohol dehydrogenase family)